MAKRSFTDRLVRRVYYKFFGRNVLYELQIRARNEAADYVSQHLHSAVIFEKSDQLLTYGLRRAVDGAILEFGVAGGNSCASLVF